MRIVLASFASLPHSIGGGEVHVLGLARALKKLGHQPSILTIEQVGAANVSVRRDAFAELPVDYLSLPACISKYDRDPRLTDWAKTWFEKQRVDVIHLFLFSHLLGLIPAANHLKIPVCLTALEFSYFCRQYDMMWEGHQHCELGTRGLTCERCALASYSKKHRALALAGRLLPSTIEDNVRQFAHSLLGQDRLVTLGQRRVTKQIEGGRSAFDQEIAAVITPSSIMWQFFKAYGAPDSKLHFIPYGTDVRNSSSGHGLPKPQTRGLQVGYIGRIDPKKGVHVLCEAVSRLPKGLPIRVKIFGPFASGPADYVSLIQGYAERDERLQLAGQLNREDLTKAYDNIDILVVPSLWYENSPITITEALALACPVLCTATAGMTDLIDDGVNGLTFPPGDSAALAGLLRRLIEEPDLLPQLRSGIRPIESSLDVACQIVQLYEKTVGNGAK